LSIGDWSVPGRHLCTGVNDRMFLADVNGDTRDDVVCNNHATGWLSVVKARADGTFPASNSWARLRHFCPNGRVHTGRFNEGPHIDLLCHSLDGAVNVDAANTSGEFWGDNWSMAGRNFCLASGDKLLVADADADGYDDMICNNHATGNLTVDYAGLGNLFDAAEWTRRRNFCRTGGELITMNLDGAAGEDLFCRDPNTGYIASMLAAGDGHYNLVHMQGPFGKWQVGLGKCLGLTSGNFDGGDARDDLLCEEMNSAGTSRALRVQYNEFSW